MLLACVFLSLAIGQTASQFLGVVDYEVLHDKNLPRKGKEPNKPGNGNFKPGNGMGNGPSKPGNGMGNGPSKPGNSLGNGKPWSNPWEENGTGMSVCKKKESATCEDHKNLPHPKCCADTGDSCSAIFGKCKLDWQDDCKCDAKIESLCGFGSKCYCCVSCKKDNNSQCALSRGTCMKDCGRFMYEDSENVCTSDKCKCCKPCTSVNCNDKEGTCVSEESFCKNGYYFNKKGCKPKTCGCCIPCKVTQKCMDRNGYSERMEKSCRKGYQEYIDNSKKPCKCCAPENPDECSRAACPNMTDTSFAIKGECFQNFNQRNAGVGTQCSCCYPGSWQTCSRESSCRNGDGYCSGHGCGDCKDYEAAGECISYGNQKCSCCQHVCHKNEGVLLN